MIDFLKQPWILVQRLYGLNPYLSMVIYYRKCSDRNRFKNFLVTVTRRKNILKKKGESRYTESGRVVQM